MSKKEKAEDKKESKAKVENKEELKEAIKGTSKTKEEKSDNQKIIELTSHLQHLQAEFENYKKRTDKECFSFREFANAELLLKFLTLLENFEIALKKQDDPMKFAKGVEMIYSEFHSLLEKEGIKKIDVKGKQVDPTYHDVLMQAESDEKEGTIIEELQPGYMLKDRILRHSKVKIAKSKKE